MIAVVDMCKEVRQKCKKKKRRVLIETTEMTDTSNERGNKFKEEKQEIELSEIERNEMNMKESKSIRIWKRIRGKRKLPFDK